ncbi:MAG: protein kinase, partial [Anaerolineaceae bacterium]|nr:protein kinase [Anaerolineaceae bacterium]
MDSDITFGNLIRSQRLRIGLSQAELAGRVGCATITLRKIEADVLRPSSLMAERLALCLDIPHPEWGDFIRLARRNPNSYPSTARRVSLTPTPEEIGVADLRGRAIHGFTLGERIGTGGYGVVYRAFQPTVERDVAIKIILPIYSNQPEFIRRFESEARLIAHLEHPHIVPLYDYWREPNAAYLVMRWLRGGNLRDLLQQGPLEPGLISQMIYQICAGLYSAHRSGIIHRDIKPANILLDEDRNAYLGDFGIAKIFTDVDPGNFPMLTESAGLQGSTSPDPIRSERPQPQVDIYCLGLLLFEMFAGVSNSQSTSPDEALSIHLGQPSPDLLPNESRLSTAIHHVIETATAKDPGARFPDIPCFLEEFRKSFQQTFLIPTSERLVKVILPDQPENPYKGLRAFNEADAADFFGREVAVRNLLGLMSEENDLSRFVAIVGPSGCGKSSLVMAGLIPALRRGGLPSSENWFITVMTPASHPAYELELALQRVAVNNLGNLKDDLMDGDYGLVHTIQALLPEDEITELVLVVDQFEELFTLTENEEERSQFLRNLVYAVIEPNSRVRLVITMRADYLDRPLQYVDFGEVFSQRTMFVLPLTPDELEMVIAAPAERAGMTLEMELVKRLTAEVGNQPGTLPLLEYALTELFERRRGRLMTLQSYLESSGVSGALANRAEQIYASLTTSEKDAARHLFLGLVTPNENGEDSRRRVTLNELKELEKISTEPEKASGIQFVDQLLEKFNRFRLLTFDHDPISRSPTVEVAHEALLSQWPRLHAWIEVNRSDLLTQRQLNRESVEWAKSNRDPSFLLRGSHLEMLITWAQTTDLSLSKGEKEFLDASAALRQAEQDAERERKQQAQRLHDARRRLRQALLIVLAIGLLGAGGFAAYALNQRQMAQKQAAVLLASQAETELKNGFGDRAVLLALETLEKYPYVPLAERALGRAVSYNRALQECRGHTSAATSIAWSPGGTQIASTSSIDNHVIIWDAATCQMQKVINLPKGITGNVLDMGLSATWSPDGKNLLILTGDRYTVGSQDYTLILWNVEQQKQVASVKVSNQAEPEMGGGIATV